MILRGAQPISVPESPPEDVVAPAAGVRALTRTWVAATAAGLLLTGAFACAVALESATPGETLFAGTVLRQLLLLRDVWLLFLVVVPGIAALTALFFGGGVSTERRGFALTMAAAAGQAVGSVLLIAASAVSATIIVRAGIVASALAGLLSGWQAVRATRGQISTFARVWRIAALASSAAFLAMIAVSVVAPRDPVGFDHALRTMLDPLIAAAALYAIALVARALDPGNDTVVVGCASSMALLGATAAAAGLFAGSPATDMIASFFSLLLSVPAVILIVRWMTRLAPRPDVSYAFAVAGMVFFVATVATGVHLAVPDAGPQLRGTAFAAGHQVFLLATLAAATLTVLAEHGIPMGWPAPALLLAGVAATAVPLLVAGASGLPRLADPYLPRFQWVQITSGCGLALVVTALTLVGSAWLRQVKRA